MTATRQRNKGFTLLELLLVLTIMGAIAITKAQEITMQVNQAMAREAGTHLYQYNAAVQRWLAYNPGASGTFTGTSWLKDSSCGGSASQAYLHCSFSDTAPAGNMTYTTTVTTVDGVTSAATELSPLLLNNEIRADLSGLSALIASGGVENQIIASTFTNGIRFTSDPNTGVISAIIDGTLNDDAWLRTDGTNMMKASLSFNQNKPVTDRAIRNVAALYNKAGEALSIGDGSMNSGVIFNADTEVLQNLIVRGELLVDQEIVTAGNITAGADLEAGNDIIIGADAIIAGSTDSNQVQIAQNGNIGGSLSVGNDIRVANDVSARDLTISNDATVSQDIATTNLAVNNNSALNTVELQGSFYDNNVPTFLFDPEANNIFNQIDISNLVINEVHRVNTACAPNGLLARKASGQLINCINGVWREARSDSALMGILYTNSRNLLPPNRWGISNQADCVAANGQWVRAFNSSRRRTRQGSDNVMFCMNRSFTLPPVLPTTCRYDSAHRVTRWNVTSGGRFRITTRYSRFSWASDGVNRTYSKVGGLTPAKQTHRQNGTNYLLGRYITSQTVTIGWGRTRRSQTYYHYEICKIL